MGLGSGKTYSGSRIQGSKRHRIPDLQHWIRNTTSANVPNLSSPPMVSSCAAPSSTLRWVSSCLAAGGGWRRVEAAKGGGLLPPPPLWLKGLLPRPPPLLCWKGLLLLLLPPRISPIKELSAELLLQKSYETESIICHEEDFDAVLWVSANRHLHSPFIHDNFCMFLCTLSSEIYQIGSPFLVKTIWTHANCCINNSLLHICPIEREWYRSVRIRNY
jgi:hypothetical protein